MIIKIPQNNLPTQINKGDIFGDIWASYGIDLISSPGKIRLSPKTYVQYSNEAGDYGDTDMVYPIAFVTGAFLDSTLRTWILCDKYLFRTTAVNTQGIPTYGAFTQDATTDTPSDLSHFYSDGIEFNGSLIVSKDTDLHKLTAGTWTLSWWQGAGNLNQSALTSSVPTPLGKSFNNLLLIGDANQVHAVDTSNNVTTGRLVFPVEYRVQWIRSSSTMVYIGCRNVNGGRAKVFAWDGGSVNYNYDYVFEGSESYSGVIKDEVPYTINERGQLLALTGSAFTEVARLPIANTDFNLSSNWAPTVNVCRNGMAVKDGRVHILLQASIGSDDSAHLENQVSGIWCFDEDMGLFNRYPITKITPMTSNVDYGSPIIKKPGVLLSVDKTVGNFLIGCSMFLADGSNPTATVRHCILTVTNNDTDRATARSGYIITSKIRTQQVREAWDGLYLLFKKLSNSTDKIVVKYRTEDPNMVGADNYDRVIYPVICTWATTTTFTTTGDIAHISVGDEIEIMSGEGSGISATITAISIDGSTYTVTIDETVTNASGTFMGRFSNWTKLGTFSTQELDWQYFSLSGIDSVWIQFKIIMFGKGKSPEIENIFVKSEPKIKIE